MKHLGISGGGTKIGGLFGAAEVLMLDKGYQPDIISGISAGAVLSVPLALGKFEMVRSLVVDFDLKDFFSVSPVNANGKIRVLNAIVKIIGGKRYLGKQDNLPKTLAKVVSEQEFNAYKSNNTMPICIVGSVNFQTGGRVYINLKEVSYTAFLDFVNASASLPVFTKGVEVNTPFQDFEGRQFNEPAVLYDGGVRDHIGTARILVSDAFDISETVSIYSRPEDYRLVIESAFPKNILETLSRYIDITNVEVSKNDEFMEQEILKDRPAVCHDAIYLPRIMRSVYDVDKGRLRQMYEAGRLAAHDWSPKAPQGPVT